jgi:ABC-type proline/glycine betaine transport system substrate-binding protein
MIAKLLSGAALASFLLAVSAPASFAADAPKDKASCEKAGMKWDEATKTCVKA